MDSIFEIDRIYNEDCLTGMQRIPDGIVDCVICDLPYGTTACAWDNVIPFEPLWEQYCRVCKDNAAIVLFSQQPFTTMLIGSNPKMFRYEWIWQKEMGTGFLNAKRMPMKCHENIAVFYRKLPIYNPQMKKGKPYKTIQGSPSSVYGDEHQVITDNSGERYPVTILKFNRDATNLHPTQKPVDLIRYLVMTYTNVGGVVLDNCMGSGTTAIACIMEKRHFIGFELNKEYYDIAYRRIANEQRQLTLF